MNILFNFKVKLKILFKRIVGYYRNCFEQSTKHANDQVLQLLSLECIHSFINVIFELYEDNYIKEIEILAVQGENNYHGSNKICLNDKTKCSIEGLSNMYVKEILEFSNNLTKQNILNFGQEIKKFSVNFIECTDENFLKKNSFKLLIASNAFIYYMVDIPKKPIDCDILINKILMFDECDFSEDSNCQIELFGYFLEKTILKLTANSLIVSDQNLKQINLIVKQIDFWSAENVEKSKKLPNQNNSILAKTILKCCWIYLFDVEIGFLENFKLDIIEKSLFNQTSDDILSEDINYDITYLKFAIKSNLDSLYKIIQMLSCLESMDRELEQIFFNLIESNFYKNSLIKSVDELSLNKIICLDFVLFAIIDLLFDRKKNFLPITTNSDEILWKYLIESLFFSLSLQANLECSQVFLPKNSYKDNLNKYFLSKKKKLFSSVYSNLNETNEFICTNRTKSLDLSDKCKQNYQIIQSIFYFLNKSKITSNIISNRIDLIDYLANKAYDCIFNKLFVKLLENNDSCFDHVWKLCSFICQFSKRFLTEEPKLRIQHDYFSFNFLIIDKLEDLLTRLMAEKDFLIFFTDIWLNVFLAYFEKVFSKCGSMQKFPIQSDKTRGKKSKNLKENYENEPCFIVDFSIFKKIIYMIQNVFEMYNSSDLNLDYIQYMNKRVSFDKNVVNTPSISPSTSVSSPLPMNHDFNEPYHLLQKLELYKNELNDKSKGELASNIFYKNTVSLLFDSNDKMNPEIYCIDQIYNLNNILLIPYKRLMLNNNLETNLRDTILASICELIERNSYRFINCWNLLFHCLSGIVLDQKLEKHFPNNSNSNESESSAYSSEDETGHKASSFSSERYLTKSSFNLSSIAYRFESYRIRLNSLKQVFNIFLELAQDSEYLMAYGAFDFIKCVSNYLQYTTTISIEFTDKIVVHKIKESDPIEENFSSDQENEDLFLSANDYSIQERHYHFTSNFEHLSDLSNTANSNTQNKAFVNCIQKMFEIIYKCKQNNQNCKISIEIKNFEISTFEKYSNFDLEKLKRYLTNDKINDIINFEDQDQIDELNFEFRNFLINDTKNYTKIIIFIFKNLCSRILMAHDEINSVQIVLLVFDLAWTLAENNDQETLGYVILNVLLKEVIFLIDLCEIKNVKIESIESKFNPKLLINSFFISNLVFKIIEKIIILCTKFIRISKSNLFQKLIIYSITNRIFILILKCLIKRSAHFDSLTEVNYTYQLRGLYEACFEYDDLNLSKNCQKSIRLFHSFSIIPFEILGQIQQTNDNKNFFNMEVLTQKCKTAWELHNVKKAFQYAKFLLNSNSMNSNQSFDDLYNECKDFESEYDPVSINDDKNFFRDFSLKFSTNTSLNASKIFRNSDDFKHINLTCFINIFKFHSDLLNLFKYLSHKTDSDFFYEVIRCVTQTYLVSIRLEKNLSLKILLSKIFYLNYENSLATFVNLTKKSFYIIDFLYYNKEIVKIELNLNWSHEKVDCDSLSNLDETENLTILINKDPKKNFFSKYFLTLISQVNSFYKFLFENLHQIEIAEGFKSFLEKFENKDLSGYSEEMINNEIEIFIEDFKSNNKINLELNDMSKNANEEKNYLKRDRQNLFKVWSKEIVPSLLVSLSKPISEEYSEIYLVNLINFYSSQNNSKKQIIKNLAELILIFNSCSAFCKCSANIENEFSFLTIDIKTFRSISNKLMSILAILVSKN